MLKSPRVIKHDSFLERLPYASSVCSTDRSSGKTFVAQDGKVFTDRRQYLTHELFLARMKAPIPEAVSVNIPSTRVSPVDKPQDIVVHPCLDTIRSVHTGLWMPRGPSVFQASQANQAGESGQLRPGARTLLQDLHSATTRHRVGNCTTGYGPKPVVVVPAAHIVDQATDMAASRPKESTVSFTGVATTDEDSSAPATTARPESFSLPPVTTCSTTPAAQTSSPKYSPATLLLAQYRRDRRERKDRRDSSLPVQNECSVPILRLPSRMAMEAAKRKI